MIISINGNNGSGKSTCAKKIAEKLNWPYYGMGNLRRQKAKERGLTLEEYNELGENDPATDLEVDEYQAQLGKEADNFIIDGRTSWRFIPHSLKIFLDIDELEGAKRIFHSLKEAKERNEGKNLNTLEAVLASSRKRVKSDNYRYKKYFNIEVYDKKNYDFVVDTTNMNAEEVFETVMKYIKAKLK
jgi:CMP/dCMP kinase